MTACRNIAPTTRAARSTRQATLRLGIIAFGLCAGASACTIDNGNGWALLAAELSATVATDDAHATGVAGELRTDLYYTVRVDRLDLRLAGVALYAAHEQATQSESPGTLCHGGHCHTTTAGLQLDLASRAAALTAAEEDGHESEHVEEPFAVLPVPGLLAAVGAEPLRTDALEVGGVHIGGLALPVTEVVIEGLLVGEEVPLRVRLEPAEPLALALAEGALSLETGPDGPEAVWLLTELSIPATLFDGIAFDGLVRSGTSLLIDATVPDNAPAGEAILAQLALASLALELETP